MSRFRPPEPPAVVDGPPAGRVLVLAPHPDDESVGAGGTLALHADQGDPITAVFACSGIQGDPEGWYPREELVAVRRAEAEAAARVLGIAELRFLGYPDNLSDADIHVFGNLPPDPDEARRALAMGFAGTLAALVADGGFEIVYHPWDGELNGDHWLVGQAVTHLKATRSDLARGISWMGYDVWSPCVPDTVVDVSDVMERKLRAVRCYESQLLYNDYEHAVAGLDAARSLLLERGATYGEGFVGRYRTEPVT